MESVAGTSHTNLQVYNCEEELFLNRLEKNRDAYIYYVIIPHFKTGGLRHVSFTQICESL
jgi:hypothetical protein